MSKGVAVTGMGIISSIGKNVEENYHSLHSGSHGISFPAILETIHKDLPVGEIKLSNLQLSQTLHLPEKHSFTRAALLGAVAVKEALDKAATEDDLQNIGFISATSVGGMDMTEKHYLDYPEKNENRRFIPAQHPGFTTDQIASFFNLNGFVTTVSTACSSAANAIMLGARMIRAGKLKRAIVGGTDCLTKFTLNGFNSLMILSPQRSRPFDENRNGLNLGEGAAYLVLEAEDVLQGKEVLGRIAGYGNANDAFHQTASSRSGEGAFLAMKKAFEVAGLSPDKIGYINAHGTATRNNDLSESRALERVFGKELPDFSSTKSFTGHTLAAAGALEGVYGLLALENSHVFPNLNFHTPMQETGWKPVVETKQKKINYILSNSFGFGGNCTSLIFSRNGE